MKMLTALAFSVVNVEIRAMIRGRAYEPRGHVLSILTRGVHVLQTFSDWV